MEPERYQKVEQLFDIAESGRIRLATSLYVFSELYAIALENAPDILNASDVAKEAIQSILQTKIILLPFPGRIQRTVFSHRLAELRDTSDLSHAISAIVNNCEAIITYDIL
jgi:predicted nucleic acid-binding protein